MFLLYFFAILFFSSNVQIIVTHAACLCSFSHHRALVVIAFRTSAANRACGVLLPFLLCPLTSQFLLPSIAYLCSQNNNNIKDKSFSKRKLSFFLCSELEGAYEMTGFLVLVLCLLVVHGLATPSIPGLCFSDFILETFWKSENSKFLNFE
ncbi:hypothetical protein HJG60_010515 [Phyllostomus discolor]|uniref:Uncharacterized protein n=1 Tax=Phyllostomus discolor TaxID=89673 RepID=A0A834ANX0_9CHIR|nr:hypothetical protein HJG60_010515 [Phyllostomus discolor]